METRSKRLVAVLGIAAMLEACAFQSGTTYSPAETGAVMRVESAEIVASREVLIAGLDDKQAAGWGTVVGATIAGATAYGITEADNPAGVAITIIAAVVGGLAGLAAEERRETRRGVEYILRDDTGKRFAVVQSLGSAATIYEPGTSVSLIYGSRGYVRVVPDETPARLDLDQGTPERGGATSRREGGEPQVGEAMRPAVLWADSRKATNRP